MFKQKIKDGYQVEVPDNWLKNGNRINAAEAVKTGILHWKEAGLPYIWGNLDDKWNLKDKAVLAAIGVFGTFVIYSLFQVSVRKRMSQYSVMQTLGMESKRTFGNLQSHICREGKIP